MRIHARKDTNHDEIVRELRQIGASVTTLHQLGHGVVDLLCGYRGVNYLFEVKRDGKSKLTPDEAKWQANWRGTVHRIDSIGQALYIIGATTRP